MWLAVAANKHKPQMRVLPVVTEKHQKDGDYFPLCTVAQSPYENGIGE
jgi:hypothetical protein